MSRWPGNGRRSLGIGCLPAAIGSAVLLLAVAAPAYAAPRSGAQGIASAAPRRGHRPGSFGAAERRGQ